MEYKFPVFVISLARATDRRKRMTSRLNQAGVKFEIVDAVDGETMNMNLIKPRLIDDLIKLRGLPKTTTGAIGCFLSHYNLWARMIEEQIPFALILEDDSIWDDDFFDVAKAVVESKYYWNIAHMSHAAPAKIEEEIDQVGERQLLRFRYAQCCTDAYLIDLDGAKKMHKFCRLIQDNIDEQWRFYWKSGCYFYHVDPAPARQDRPPDFTSFIKQPKIGREVTRNRRRHHRGLLAYWAHKIKKHHQRKMFHKATPRKLR